MRDIYKNFEYSRNFRNFRKNFLINGENLYGVPKFLICPEIFFGGRGVSPKIIRSKKFFSGTGRFKNFFQVLVGWGGGGGDLLLAGNFFLGSLCARFFPIHHHVRFFLPHSFAAFFSIAYTI